MLLLCINRRVSDVVAVSLDCDICSAFYVKVDIAREYIVYCIEKPGKGLE